MSSVGLKHIDNQTILRKKPSLADRGGFIIRFPSSMGSTYKRVYLKGSPPLVKMMNGSMSMPYLVPGCRFYGPVQIIQGFFYSYVQGKIMG